MMVGSDTAGSDPTGPGASDPMIPATTDDVAAAVAAATKILKRGDLVRVLERRGSRVKERAEGLGRIHRSVPIPPEELKQPDESSSASVVGVGGRPPPHPFRYDVDWVLGGRASNVPRCEIIHTTATAEGLTEAPPRRKRKPSSIVVEAEAAAKKQKTAAATKGGKKKKAAGKGKGGGKSSSSAPKKSGGRGGKGGGASNAKKGKRGGGAKVAAPSPVPDDDDAAARQTNALNMFERHRREFDRLRGRLERIDPFGFFLGQPPPAFVEIYANEQSQSETGQQGAEQMEGEILAQSRESSASEKESSITPALSAESTDPDKKKVASEITYPSHPPFNWTVVTKRMDRGRYLLDRQKEEDERRKELRSAYAAWKLESASAARVEIERPTSLVRSDTPAKKNCQKSCSEMGSDNVGADEIPPMQLLHGKGINWDVFRQDVVGMCESAIARDPEGTTGGSGTLGHAASKIRETIEQMYTRTGQRQLAEMNLANMRDKYASTLKSSENNEAAMQCDWRRDAFPERRYERLAESNVVCAGLSTLDERSAVYELKTSLPDSFVGLSYTYDDMGQSEGWMKSVVDEADNSRKRGRKKKDEAEEERRAAMALAADDGVVRAQVRTSMDILLLGVQDKVMTDSGVLQHPEVRSANWDDGDVRRSSGGVHDSAVQSSIIPSDRAASVAEQPVWGIDCYTRKNISICLETDFESDVALEFIEKWLLPAINSCPLELAHNMSCAARVLEGLPAVAASSTAEGESEESVHSNAVASHTSGDHVFLSEALADKINTCGPPWLKEAAHRVRMAVESLGTDLFRIHPKGHGSVVLRKEGLPANTLVTYYRGEVYPPWRWGEKLDAIEQTQKRIGLRPNLPDFYNMALERPRVDPRGFGLLFVDASRKAGLGSSFSHSCDPTCEVKVVAVNGQLSLAMTTLRDLERGEELSFDYHAVTESVDEYHFAICLCGHRKCRGSFLHFAAADCYQQVLSRNAPIAVQFSNLAKGCMKKVLAKEDGRVLESHGFGTAAFGAVGFNHYRGGDEPLDSMDNIPIWLRTFVSDTLRYIEYERRALPIALLSNHFTQKNQQPQAGKCSSKESKVGPSSKSKKPAKSSSASGKKAKTASKATKGMDASNAEPKIPSKDSKPIPGSKPEPVFLYFSKKQRDSFLKIVQEQGMGDLTGLALNGAVQKIAGTTWKSLSDDMKQYWKDRVFAEWEMNGGREKAKLEDERKLRVQAINAASKQTSKEPHPKQDGNANAKKRKLEETQSQSNGKTNVGEKKKTGRKSRKAAETIETNKISFEAADAEGWAAMEQRIHQLTQTLSRVGRVLDRHREADFVSCGLSRSTATTDFLRDRIHSPLAMLSDEHVVGWLWNHPKGVTQTLLRIAKEKPWSKTPLKKGLREIVKRHGALNGFPYLSGDGSFVPSKKSSGRTLPPSEARRLAVTALLQLRDEVMRSIRGMEEDVQRFEKQQYETKAKAKRLALRQRREARKQAKDAKAKEALLVTNAASGAVEDEEANGVDEGMSQHAALGPSGAGTSNESRSNLAVMPESNEQYLANKVATESSDRLQQSNSDSSGTSLSRIPVQPEAVSLTSKSSFDRVSPSCSLVGPVKQTCEGGVAPQRETASVSQLFPERACAPSTTMATIKTLMSSTTEDRSSKGGPDNAPHASNPPTSSPLVAVSSQVYLDQAKNETAMPAGPKHEATAPLAPVSSSLQTDAVLVKSKPIQDDNGIEKAGTNVLTDANDMVQVAVPNGSKKERGSLPSPKDGTKVLRTSPWKKQLQQKYKLESAADLLLIYAHTSTFFSLKPYQTVESTPIEVYARELGNSVPRTLVETAEAKERKSSVLDGESQIAKNPEHLDGGETKFQPPDEPSVPTHSDAGIDPKEKISKSKSASSKKEGKEEPVEICEPDEIITSVNVNYPGHYVLACLLQWYAGGISLKPDLPDMNGCIMLPPMSSCWTDKAEDNEADSGTTLYNTEVRPKLIDWFEDRHKRGSPWPEEIVRYFPSSHGEGVLTMGSPILDLLITGNDQNIHHVIDGLRLPNADEASSEPETSDGTKRKQVKKSAAERLQSTVDEGMPAQAVANWVQCENPDCMKWRKLPWHVDVDLLPAKFFCKDNQWNPGFDSCTSPEDVWDMNDAPVKFNEIPLDEFRRGARFDVLRKGKKQYSEGIVVNMDFESEPKRVMFHFHRMNAKWDEWVEADSTRIAPHQAYTRAVPEKASTRKKASKNERKENTPLEEAKVERSKMETSKNNPVMGEGSGMKEQNTMNAKPVVSRKPSAIENQAHRSAQTNVTIPSFTHLQAQGGGQQQPNDTIPSFTQLQAQGGGQQQPVQSALSAYALGNSGGRGGGTFMAEANTFRIPKEAASSATRSAPSVGSFAPSVMQADSRPPHVNAQTHLHPASSNRTSMGNAAHLSSSATPSYEYGQLNGTVVERSYHMSPTYEASVRVISRDHNAYPNFPRAPSTQEARNNEEHRLPNNAGYGSFPWPPAYQERDYRDASR